MLPNFLIVGAQRCGTTYLYGLLKQHPEIFLPDGKEVHFFDQKHSNDIVTNFDKYNMLFKSVKKEIAIGEITPSYMYVKWVPKLIRSYNGKMKIIFLLRNPIDRSYSHYWFNISEGREFLSFKQALKKEPDRIAIRHQDMLIYSYISRGFYIEQINRFLSYFPPEKMMFILSEEFFKNPKIHLKNICEFLRVSKTFQYNLDVHKNRMEIPKYSAIERYLIRINQYTSDWKYAALIKKSTNNIRKFIPKIDYRYPPMKRITREYLKEIFYSSNKKLGEFLKKDLKLWS